jgi:hypothetical protein
MTRSGINDDVQGANSTHSGRERAGHHNQLKQPPGQEPMGQDEETVSYNEKANDLKTS